MENAEVGPGSQTGGNFPYLNGEEMLKMVVGGIKKDPLAVDLHLCLIAAACNSYRRGTRMKPLPVLSDDDSSVGYNQMEDMDIKAKKVSEVVNSVPSLTQVMTNPKCLDETQKRFLYWTTCQLRTRLRCCRLHELPRGVTLTNPLPDYIFKVAHSETKENEFTNLCLNRETFYALHGSSLENFHSIVQCGLLGSLSKTGLFGDGVYLSNEQSVSMNHSHSSHGWVRSKIGSSLSCVAVCEVIDNKQHVLKGRCVGSVLSDESSRTGSSSDITGIVNQGASNTKTTIASKPSDFPESYVLVKNGEMLILRYILVYRTARSKMRRRLNAIYEECFSWIVSLFVIALALIAYFSYTLFADEEERQYLTTDYIHHNVIV